MLYIEMIVEGLNVLRCPKLSNFELDATRLQHYN